MKNSCLPVLALFIALFSTFQGIAATKLNELVKEQQRNDRNVFQENKVEKKDLFSSVAKIPPGKVKLPAEKACYLIRKLIIENAFIDTQVFNDVKRAVEGHCLGVKGIETVATLIQDYFIKAGFITTRVETPSQNLASQQLLLRVVPGRIAKVIIENKDFRDWILPFGKEDVLNIRDIEQGLENIQRTPGTDVRINIVPGEAEGYSNIVISINRTTFWNLHTSWNNWGDESTGRQLINGAAYLYNTARLNDLFWLAGTTSTTRNYKNFSSYYSIPVGYWEYEIFYSQSKSQQPIDISYLKFDYTGKNKYLSLKGSRTLYRDQNKKITGSAELLRRKAEYSLDDIELALQKRDMGNIRLAVNYKQNIANGVFDSTLRWQRFLTWFGGEKTPDMISGDVNSASQIFSLYLHYLKWLPVTPLQVYYDANIGTQYARHALTLQDQFAIGNRWTVRGFENSIGLDGNSGFYLQNTVGFLTGYRNIELYMGADYGQVNAGGSAQSLYAHNKIMGMAVGLKGLVKSLAYDFSLTTPVIYPHDFNVDKFTANFNVSVQL